MNTIDIIELIFTLLSLLQPLVIFVVIIAIVIKSIKSNGNAKYGNRNGQPYNMNQYNQPYNMNQNGQLYGMNQYTAPYNMNQNQNFNGAPYYNSSQSVSVVDDNHNHTYSHKVEPIEEASVHTLAEERKEAYLDRKQQMKEDLPKTSYSKMEEMNIVQSDNLSISNAGTQVDENSNAAWQMNDQHEKVICKNCGAENLVPRIRNTAYSCYFCKEMI